MSAHHPTLCRTGRYGCWAECVCGWESQVYTTVTGAHLAFGQHLSAASGLQDQPLCLGRVVSLHDVREPRVDTELADVVLAVNDAGLTVDHLDDEVSVVLPLVVPDSNDCVSRHGGSLA